MGCLEGFGEFVSLVAGLDVIAGEFEDEETEEERDEEEEREGDDMLDKAGEEVVVMVDEGEFEGDAGTVELGSFTVVGAIRGLLLPASFDCCFCSLFPEEALPTSDVSLPFFIATINTGYVSYKHWYKAS